MCSETLIEKIKNQSKIKKSSAASIWICLATEGMKTEEEEEEEEEAEDEEEEVEEDKVEKEQQQEKEEKEEKKRTIT